MELRAIRSAAKYFLTDKILTETEKERAWEVITGFPRPVFWHSIYLLYRKAVHVGPFDKMFYII